MLNTAYIGLFDRSFLHMSLNQVDLVLKNATSESCTPVFFYQFKFEILFLKGEFSEGSDKSKFTGMGTLRI